MKKLILSVAFLGLGVFGFAQQTSKADKAQKRAEHLQQMKQELNLTDAQVAQLNALHEANAAERQQEMASKKAERMQKMQQNNAELQKILTPEQYKKYQDIKAKKMAEKKANFQSRRAATTVTK
ncbi:Spy/CpxP family protein refolding chaperone [Chryseobacterium sp. SC28]|uniref:Spy/CpxP family protein refolding chaperone n=1 Tax=Chryseobacterium sp. SC28 TaxID=2268028 RepID=UPI000F64C02F|nr:Spy/CpxP family protein refolding chaperone [Chryseobacterium sp. SC28]RRQ45639.1 hypothetical protein DTW91_09115 [Chryseobacterium sp. SC28]